VIMALKVQITPSNVCFSILCNMGLSPRIFDGLSDGAHQPPPSAR
jgi:hypothetical protein